MMLLQLLVLLLLGDVSKSCMTGCMQLHAQAAANKTSAQNICHIHFFLSL
jgi:hypothetical protein